MFPGVNASDLVTLVWIGFFALTFLYQTRIQSYLALSEISRGLNKLKVMKDKARKDTIDYLVNVGKATNDPSPRVDQFLDYVAIMPVDMDPAGIVGKIDHIVTTRFNSSYNWWGRPDLNRGSQADSALR